MNQTSRISELRTHISVQSSSEALVSFESRLSLRPDPARNLKGYHRTRAAARPGLESERWSATELRLVYIRRRGRSAHSGGS
jgi:hypothetical protein